MILKWSQSSRPFAAAFTCWTALKASKQKYFGMKRQRQLLLRVTYLRQTSLLYFLQLSHSVINIFSQRGNLIVSHLNAVFKDVALDEVHLEEGETEDVIKVTLPQLEEMAEKKMLSPAVWDHMAGYKDEFYRLFD